MFKDRKNSYKIILGFVHWDKSNKSNVCKFVTVTATSHYILQKPLCSPSPKSGKNPKSKMVVNT